MPIYNSVTQFIHHLISHFPVSNNPLKIPHQNVHRLHHLLSTYTVYWIFYHTSLHIMVTTILLKMTLPTWSFPTLPNYLSLKHNFNHFLSYVFLLPLLYYHFLVLLLNIPFEEFINSASSSSVLSLIAFEIIFSAPSILLPPSSIQCHRKLSTVTSSQQRSHKELHRWEWQKCWKCASCRSQAYPAWWMGTAAVGSETG